MTDRIFALTVVLEKGILTGDCEEIINAIARFRGVVSITTHAPSPELYAAEARAKAELRGKILGVL